MHQMRTYEANRGIERSWWRQRSPLEKIGIGSLGVVGVLVTGIVLFPHVAAAAAGGALTASGALLLKKGLGG